LLHIAIIDPDLNSLCKALIVLPAAILGRIRIYAEGFMLLHKFLQDICAAEHGAGIFQSMSGSDSMLVPKMICDR